VSGCRALPDAPEGKGCPYVPVQIAVHVVERWTLVDADTINYEATIEDPAVFTSPWTMRFAITRILQDGYEFFEEACYEGNRTEHRLAAGRLAVAAGERRLHTHEESK